MDLKKILIIRFSSIGDIIITSPVIRCIKKSYPNCEIHFITKKKFEELLSNNPNLTKIYSIEKHLKEVIKSLQLEDYDLVIDLHKNLRSKHLILSLQKKSLSFNKLQFDKWLLVNFKINRLSNKKHLIDRYFEGLECIGVENDGGGFDFFYKSGYSPKDIVKEILETDYSVLSIGGAHFTKRLPKEKIIELIGKLEGRIVIVGGESEKKIGTEVEALFPNNVMNLSGSLSLFDTAKLIEHAKTVFTNDTATLHIASAFRKRICSFWGSTVREFGFFPYPEMEWNYYAEVEGLGCRPCSKIGHKACPKGHFNCMIKIDMDEVGKWAKINQS